MSGNFEVENEEQDATDMDPEAVQEEQNNRPVFQVGGEEPVDEDVIITDENSQNSNGTAPASLTELMMSENTNAVDEAEESLAVMPIEPDAISLTTSEGADSNKPKVKTPSRATLAPECIHVPIQPADIVEYEWPQKSGDRFFVQEQISELLGISSFKRKYPEMFRRTVEPKERDYLLKELKIRIALPSHYQTALQSVDVHELMASEYPEIYAAYQKACNERMKQAMLEKQKELDAIKMDAKKMAELRQKAIKSAHEFNADLQAVRKSERTQYWDLNTNIIHSPINKWMRLSSEHTKPTKYPVFCLPGQFTDYYKRFTPSELRTLPLNTILAGHNELFPPKRDHSPPPILVTDEEVATAAAKISKLAAETTTPTPLVATKTELSAPPTPQLHPESTPATAGNDNLNEERGTEQPPRSLKRIKREPPEMGNASASALQMQATPPKLRKMSSTNNNGSNKRGKNSTCPRLPTMTSRQPPPSPKTSVPPSPKNQSQQQSSSVTAPLPVCSICQLSEASPHNKAALVRCSACNQQMHSSCIDMPPSMVQVIRQYDWLCIDCKRCCVCEQPDQEAAMMCCDQCDRGYHTFCIGLDQPPNGTWHCPECIKDNELPEKRRRKPKNFYLNLSGKSNLILMEESSIVEEEGKPTSSNHGARKRSGPTKYSSPTPPDAPSQ